MEEIEFGKFVPQIWPHYHRRGRRVYFMLSRRPALELSAQETAIFDSVDGQRNVAEIENIHPGAGEQLKRWRDAALLELIPPITPPAGPHLVVIEPHMDDAVLWAGGRLLHRRGKSRITILSVVGWSNFTSYLTLNRESRTPYMIRNRGAFSVDEVSRLRQRESALAASVLGAESRCLGWFDSLLRVVPPNRWSETVFDQFEKSPQTFVKFFPNSAEVSSLAGQLCEAMKQLRPDELWIPMGLEEHIDHRTTRNACLRMLAESPEAFKGVTVDMYEDVPHAWVKLFGQVQQIRHALGVRGTRLIPMREEIGDVLPEKIRVSTLYASQFKRSYLEPLLRGLAKREPSEGVAFAETFHRLAGRVEVPRESDMCREAPGLAALRVRTVQWLRNERRPYRLTVIALPSGLSGCWGVDTKFLLSAFPNIHLQIYVAGNCAWRIWDGGAVRFKFLRGSGWLSAAFCEFFRFGCPTLVLWRGAYGVGLQQRLRRAAALGVRSAHGLTRCLLPFRQVLFARSLSDLCGVLAEDMEGNARSEIPSPLYEAADRSLI